MFNASDEQNVAKMEWPGMGREANVWPLISAFNLQPLF